MIDPDHPALKQVRALCLALPEVTERLSHLSPHWYFREKKNFVAIWQDHHGDGRVALWCAAEMDTQETLVAQDPERFFRPPYVGHRGWLGVRLDRDLTSAEVGRFIREAHALVSLGARPRRALAAARSPAGEAPAREASKPAKTPKRPRTSAAPKRRRAPAPR